MHLTRITNYQAIKNSASMPFFSFLFSSTSNHLAKYFYTTQLFFPHHCTSSSTGGEAQVPQGKHLFKQKIIPERVAVFGIQCSDSVK